MRQDSVGSIKYKFFDIDNEVQFEGMEEVDYSVIRWALHECMNEANAVVFPSMNKRGGRSPGPIFGLLGEEFTLAEAETAMEQVQGRELDKRNFRRAVIAAKRFEETGGTRGGKNRPAKLYRLREQTVV